MRKHIEKKILPKYFTAIRNGTKTFEIRKDEDDISVGDVLVLREWSGRFYTGRVMQREVTYVLRNCPEYGLKDGYAIFGLQPRGWDGTAAEPIAKCKQLIDELSKAQANMFSVITDGTTTK